MGLLGRYRGSEWKDSATAAECKQGFSKMHPVFFGTLTLFLEVLEKACVAKDLDMENKLESNNSEI